MKKTPRIQINEARREAFVNGKEVRLASKEFDILAFLDHSKQLVSRETIIENVWPADKMLELDSRSVDQHVARLRRKIGRDVILTVAGHGYKIAAGV